MLGRGEGQGPAPHPRRGRPFPWYVFEGPGRRLREALPGHRGSGPGSWPQGPRPLPRPGQGPLAGRALPQAAPGLPRTGAASPRPRRLRGLRGSAPESGEPPLGRPLQRAVAGAQQMRVGLVLLLQFQRGLLEAACWPPPSPNGRHRGKFAAPLRFLRPKRPPLVHSPAHLQLPLLLELLRELPLRVLPPPAPSGDNLQMLAFDFTRQ